MKREQAESALFSPEKTIVNTSALHPSSSSKVKRIFTQVDFHPRLKRVFTQSSRGSSHKAQEDLHTKLKRIFTQSSSHRRKGQWILHVTHSSPMLRSELNELFNKFKDVHKRLSDFAAGSSDENFDLVQTRNEFGALKLQLLENASRLTREQSEYLDKAKTILCTPQFKLQRIRTLSESSRPQSLLLDSSSS